MLKKLAFSICILLVMAVTSCNYVPQSDYDNLLTEYNKVLQELDATKEELAKVQIQLEETQSALEDEKNKWSYILKPAATLPDEMTLEPYGKRIWNYLAETRNYDLAREIEQFEKTKSMWGVPPWFAIETLDGTMVHIPRQEAWELYKIMNNGKSLFDKLMQLGCIPYGSKFIPDEWKNNEYFHWNAISPECLAWMELHVELADGKWIAKKYLEMIKKESDILYDIIVTEGYEAYENEIKSINKNN